MLSGTPMILTMRTADELYQTAARVTFCRVCVEDEDLRSFSVAVQRLRNRLGDDARDSYWQPALARLRRARWDLATIPLPSSDPTLGIDDVAAYVAHCLRDCQRVFPHQAADAERATELLVGLARRDTNPLGNEVVAACQRSNGTTALILQNGRRAAAVDAFMRRMGVRLTVLVPGQLSRSRIFDSALVMGPASWFPSYVFSAPRARSIHIIQFDWLRDPPLEPGVLVGTELHGHSHWISLPANEPAGTPGESLTAEDLQPVTDWGAIVVGTGARSSGSPDQSDVIEAYVFLLASDQAVYLEAEDGSRAQVVELGDAKQLRQVSTGAIQVGTYLVTRLGGEGDYIPAIADSLLGEEAARLRAAQCDSKARLRWVVDAAGPDETIARLREAGSQRASKGNLRRWLSPGSIRTEDFADFAAIMSVIGADDSAIALWGEMAKIDQAHLRAGQRVRALLNEQIVKGDTRELERRGWQDYDVPEIEGEGALRVARVESRGPERILIEARRTRELLSVERDLWQG